MNNPSRHLSDIAQEIDQITDEIELQEKENAEMLKEVCHEYEESAKNLLHYGTFRSFDVREMQERLKHLGLTRLANAEGNILGSLLNARNVINNLSLNVSRKSNRKHLSIGQGNTLLKKHADNLFGNRKENRRVRIMVTQPTEAAYSYDMVLKMVQNGMDCARINCAHDEPEVWKGIRDNRYSLVRESRVCNA
jgi:pyruvate kinase